MVVRAFGGSALLVFSIFLAFLNLRVVEGDDQDRESCPTGAIIDLTSAKKNANGFITSPGLFFPQKLTSTVDGALRGCACDVKPCLAICPPRSDEGKTLVATENHVNHSKISAIYEEQDGVSPKDRFHILVWHPCERSDAMYALEPEEYPEDEFYLLKNGSIFQPQNNGSRFTDFGTYCLDHLYDSPIYHPHICPTPDDKVPEHGLSLVKHIAGLVGAVFLIATVIVYSILPELRNIHGTILRCYLCCLIVAFITVAVAWIPRIYSNVNSEVCISGFVIYSSFMASFFWSNVLGCDMWLKLGGLGNTSTCNPKQQRKRFIFYSIYAWGMTILMTSICVGMEFTESASENVIQPGFRKRSCWFESTTSLTAYFYGPITVTLLVNICFFVLSTINVLKLRKQTQEYDTINPPSGAERTRHTQHKYWFVLIVKLFIVMGITWMMEVISGLVGGPGHIWLLTDLINVLQGVFIFIIFVCKRSIWRSLKKRFIRRGEEDSNSAMGNETCMSLNAIPERRTNVPETS